jgi:DNA modification methylase
MSAQIWNCDGIPGMTKYLTPDSCDLCVTSIPFGALFMYSGKPEDVGNNQDGTDMKAGGFGLHMRFFVHQLYRVMKPGTNVCIHIQQLLRYQNQHGYMGRRDFRGAVIDLCCAGGFEYRGEFVIPKNPQIIAKRLSLHSLQFMTGHSRNARDLSPAVNDYVLQFQKPGESTPVLCLKHSTKNPHGWVTQEEWIRDAHGVWTDIRETDVLDGWKSARESDEEKHVCPLQLEVIRRCIKLWTNPGELVLDPYMGIGSTAYVAIEQGREAIGFELKESYCDQALRNVKKAERLVSDKEKAPPLLELMQAIPAEILDAVPSEVE